MLTSILRRVFFVIVIIGVVIGGRSIWEGSRVSDQAERESAPVTEEIKSAPSSMPAPSSTLSPSEKQSPVPLSAPAPAADSDMAHKGPLLEKKEQEDAASEVPPPASPLPSLVPSSDEEEKVGEEIIQGTLGRGDTVSKVLGPHAGDQEVQKYIDATRRVFPLTSFRAGQPYVLVCDVQSGSVKRFEYEIDRHRRLVVEGENGEKPVARVEPIEYEVRLNMVDGRIEDNLFQAVADLGESPQMALLIANLFGWEINFIRDLKDGDSFSFLVEKLYREGQFKGYGRTLGATFTNKGKTYEAFLFHDSRGKENHYNIRGENLRKVLLQAPLSFTRVTSGYTRSRKHPIFGNHRAHFGVDYGAPTGTPVKAVGDGTITSKGWAGGYGNQVIVRHVAGLESMYSHLSGFARGIGKGSRVRQGQVIAFVGSTGNSTGPHLDFRLKQNNNFIDPTKAVNPRSEAVNKPNMRAFGERMELVRAFMGGGRDLGEYAPDMVAAPAPRPDPPAEEKKDKPKSRKKSKR